MLNTTYYVRLSVGCLRVGVFAISLRILFASPHPNVKHRHYEWQPYSVDNFPPCKERGRESQHSIPFHLHRNKVDCLCHRNPIPVATFYHHEFGVKFYPKQDFTPPGLHDLLEFGLGALEVRLLGKCGDQVVLPFPQKNCVKCMVPFIDGAKCASRRS